MDRGKEVEKSDCGQISSFFIAGSEQILSRVDRPGNSNLSILFEDVKDNFRNNQIFITIKNDEMEWKEVGGEGKYKKKIPQLSQQNQYRRQVMMVSNSGAWKTSDFGEINNFRRKRFHDYTSAVSYQYLLPCKYTCLMTPSIRCVMTVGRLIHSLNKG